MDLGGMTVEKIMELVFKKPKLEESVEAGRVRFDLYDNNAVAYVLDGRTVTKFFAQASVKDGRLLDTRSAKRKGVTRTTRGETQVVEIVYEEKKLRLTQRLEVAPGSGWFKATGVVKDLKNAVTESNYIAPLDFAYPDSACDPLFLSLDQKMLLVPYDNDMWVRYESVPLRPGRTSYDVTAVYDEQTNRGLVIGAVDFEDWKNAIRCSQSDARCYTAFSGVADGGTHDVCPHGYLDGESVSSAGFVCLWCEDIRDGLEEYGRLAMEGKFTAPWHGCAPFGWNSYSAGCMTLEQWQEAGRFIHDELPNFHDAAGATSINLDANFMLDGKKMQDIVDELHARGQRAGNYAAPLMGIDGMIGKLMPLKGSIGKTYESVMMRHEDGELYHKIDSGKPIDITYPAAEKNVRVILREFVKMGFDYIKIDFLSHGGLEGKRHDPSVKTGRQALNRFYRIVAEELDPAKIGREVFVDLSIAPLFPAGYAQGRRCCCDAFGHHEDVRYVLNALNYAWWTNGTLYRYNDPDHTTLYHSAVDGRGVTDFYSARSRYHASVISGTIMLLSDDFGPLGDGEKTAAARERVKAIANNEALNAIARQGRAFRPAYIRSDTAHAYYLKAEGKHYVALFNFDGERKRVSIPAALVEARSNGDYVNLDDGSAGSWDGDIGLELEGYDSAILELA